MTTPYDLETFSDCDYYNEFQFVTVDLVPIDLTGGVLQLMVRKTAAAATTLIECSTGNGRIIIDYNTVGKFSLWIPWAELRVLTAGDYVQSMILTFTQTLRREEVWRGAMRHAIGPTR